jgi:hypothetical protein
MDQLKTNTNKNFQKDLAVGKAIEEKVLSIVRQTYPSSVLIPEKFKDYDLYIPERDIKVEIKVDYKSRETGNILIELFMFEKPSALLATKADYWVIYDGKKLMWTTPNKIFECLLLNNIRSQEILGDGDSQKKIACLVPVDLFKKYLIKKNI